VKSRYGPNEKEIFALLASVDGLSPWQIASIASEYTKAGFPKPLVGVWSASGRAGRRNEVAAAGWDMTKAINLHALLSGFDDAEAIRQCAWAANNVGIGSASEDLVGNDGYSMDEYGLLVDAWHRGLAA
jgi:hypothetical protein